ncbi:aromatic ring-hydroxylating oxygenase subunit alpha [Flavisphingomonas formosensis]|uniref:aromatic ring-hydroxylating oxygenase subunit alpha n=1 Tax=Flavisphingomonas formosensis TaxID=861534 RepID=UPI0012F70AE5|nr:aromatic ring-hydroxylating dioxygenase subunit alpha [Sphingomonas formosensis]
MERAARIAIAREVIGMIERDEMQYANEPAWEVDIGRFTDKARFLKEKEEFFLNRPQLVAYSADIPENGDYYATSIAGKPILLTRGKDGKARAFLNACRHRGVQLAEGCGHASTFTCPYHAWTFNSHGDLIGVPSKDSFDGLLEDRGLIALPIHEEIGVIVVHPQPDGHLDFDAFMGPMKQHLAGYHMENLRLISGHSQTARINWKHAVDGGVEGYHVPFLHPQTVGPMTLKFFRHIDFGLHHSLVNVSPEMLAMRDMPEEEWPEYCGFSVSNAIFPNTIVSVGEGMAIFQRSDPSDDPGRCDYNIRFYGWGRNPDAEQKARDEAMAAMVLTVAMEEDMKVQSNSQIMMENGAVPSIIFGRREQNVLRMHKNYDRLIGHDAEAALAVERLDEAAE